MSVRQAWLILITAVSLFHYSHATIQKFELNSATCNRKHVMTDQLQRGLLCLYRTICDKLTCHLVFEMNDKKVDEADVLIGIRKLAFTSNVLVVLQMRGGDVKYDEGIELVTIETNMDVKTEQRMAKCSVNNGKAEAVVENKDQMFVNRVHATSSLLVCEILVPDLLDEKKKLHIRLKYSLKSKKMEGIPHPWRAVDEINRELAKIEENGEVCVDELKTERVDGYYVRPVFSWMKEVTCQTSIDAGNEMASRFRIMVKDQKSKMIEVERMWCASNRYKYKLKNDVREYAYDKKVAVCALKVCSLCTQPKCMDSDCPTFVKGSKDNCASLKCDKLYSMDGKRPIKESPTCVKIDNDKVFISQFTTAQIDSGFVDSVVWQTGSEKGTLASTFKCFASQDCPASLKVYVNSSREIVITADKVECKDPNQIMSYLNKNGDEVQLTEVVCDRSEGIWQEKRSNGTTAVFDVYSELQCNEEIVIVEQTTIPPPAAQAGIPLFTIGAGAGGFALVVIIILVVACCLFKKKKNKSKHKSLTAVSSADVNKKSSDDSALAETVNAPQAPVVVIPMSLQKKASQEKESGSDKTKKKAKKSDKKKELLKFEDSNNISENQSKKQNETEKIDILKKEAEKLNAKDKKAKNKKELAKMYPKLALDESSINQSEERGSKKQDEPSIAREHEKISQREPEADESSKMTASKKINKLRQTADLSVKQSAGNKDLQALLDNRLDDMEKLTNKTAILTDSKDGSQRKPSTQRKKKGRTPNGEVKKEKTKSQLGSDESGALNQSKTDEETDFDATK